MEKRQLTPYLLVTDLDGTLLNHNLEITPNTLSFLKEFIKDNYLLINTGRSFLHAKAYLKNLDLLRNSHIFLACNNGAEIYKYDDLIYTNYLNTKQIIFYLEQTNIKILNLFGQLASNLQLIALNNNNIADLNFNQLDLITNTSQLPKTWNNYHFIYKGEFENKHLYYVQNDKKHLATQYLANLLNIPNNAVFVFGDGYNDLKMLEVYENSFLMPNSKIKDDNKHLKLALANNEQDGIVKTIQHTNNFKQTPRTTQPLNVPALA